VKQSGSKETEDATSIQDLLPEVTMPENMFAGSEDVVEEEAESQEEDQASEAKEWLSMNTTTTEDGRKFSEPETTTTEDSQTTESALTL